MRAAELPSALSAVRARRVILGGTVALLLLAFAALALGARPGSPAETLSALRHLVTGVEPESFTELAVQSRVPRILTALTVGAALAAAGVGLQAITLNPLGDPGILGLTTGATLAIVVGIALGTVVGTGDMVLWALLGTVAAAALVLGIGQAAARDSTASSTTALVLTGAALSAGATAATTGVLILRPQVLERFRFWNVGSVARAEYGDLLMVLPLVVLGLVLLVAVAPGLDALAMGDELGHGLGVSSTALRAVVFAAVVALSAAGTALAGPIGFLGIVVAYALRSLGVVRARSLVIASALWGAVLLTAADLLGRTVIAPQQIHVGVMMAVIGVPVMVLLLWRPTGGRL